MARSVEALLGFLLMVAYWPGIAGLARTPRWMVGGLIVAAFFFAPAVTWTRAHMVGAALAALMIASLIVHPQLDGGDALGRLLIVMVAFAYGSTLADSEPFVIGAMVGLSASSMIVVAESLGAPALPHLGSPAALFYNANYLAEAAALVIVALAALRLWWLIMPLLPALILPQSRGALIAAALPLLFLFDGYARGAWKMRAVLIAIATAAFLVVVHKGFDASLLQRWQLWQDSIAALTLTGYGLGSFWETFPAHAHAFDFAVAGTRPEHPHNELLLIGYEAGAVALAAAVVFAIVLWTDAQGPMRFVVGALGVIACVSVLSDNPASILFGAVCAGASVGHCGVPVVSEGAGRGALDPRRRSPALRGGDA